MDNKLTFILNIILVTILLFVVSCYGNTNNDLVGIWEGSYVAFQGETGLTLNVWKEGEYYIAIFDFYNLPGKTNAKNGKYYMYGYYDESTEKYNLIGYEWIERPSNYIFINLEGKITGRTFHGSASTEIHETHQINYYKYLAAVSDMPEEQPIINEFTFQVIRKNKKSFWELTPKIITSMRLDCNEIINRL
jgi:hypothetical protein